MDPNLKLILDELKAVRGSMDELQSSLSKRIDDVDHSWGSRFQALESAAQVFDDWKPRVDATVDDLKMEMSALRKTVHRVVVDSTPSPAAGIFTKPASAAATSPAGKLADGPEGHRVESSHREHVFGSVFTHSHLPVKGTCDLNPKLPRPASFPFLDGSDEPQCRGPRIRSDALSPQFSRPDHSRLPKLSFPPFDGENPKLWIRRSQDYFELYQVESSVWIKVAAMHFQSAAARWVQSI